VALPPKESERLAELPEVREKISEMMAAHWERWVSQPLPIEIARRWMPLRTRTDARSSSHSSFRENGSAAAPICKRTKMCSGGCVGG
jgi:hypothetical protein